ncbi:uncharacterized protein LOC135830489 [Sycon ciliatum]|uniref:uncharacterized protein LOC135830489 n=1 Tax=Sycon ciliatum TaxID=27933 RepID=UPI0031F67FAC
MYWQRCHHCVITFGAAVDCRQADMASTCAEKPHKPTYSSGLVATISSKRQYLGLRLLLLLALFLPAPTRARYGSWQCTANKKVVSRGDFRSYRFAPVLSPRIRAFRWSTALHYLNNLTCVYRLRAPFGHHIYYELPTFDLHSNCRGDNVLIAGGDRTHRMLCGSGRRLLHPYGIVRSSAVTMKFSTDASGTATGFSGFFAAFKPHANLDLASLKAGKAPIRAKREEQAGDDDDQYSEPKTAVGEINLQQMRVLTGEASLDSYCRSMKRFGWELATSSCVIHSDPWSVPSRSLTHAYRSNSNDDADFYDAAIRVLSRRSVPGNVISDVPTSSLPSHARTTANPLVQAAVRRHVRRQREEVARDTGQIPRAQRSSSRMRWQ